MSKAVLIIVGLPFSLFFSIHRYFPEYIVIPLPSKTIIKWIINFFSKKYTPQKIIQIAVCFRSAPPHHG